MKNLFVPYKIAKELEKHDFSEPCLGVYNNDKELDFGLDAIDLPGVIYQKKKSNNKKYSEAVFAPVYSQVIDWFLEKHNIFIRIDRKYEDFGKFEGYFGYIESDKYCRQTDVCKDYRKTLIRAIEKAIKLL